MIVLFTKSEINQRHVLIFEQYSAKTASVSSERRQDSQKLIPLSRRDNPQVEEGAVPISNNTILPSLLTSHLILILSPLSRDSFTEWQLIPLVKHNH